MNTVFRCFAACRPRLRKRHNDRYYLDEADADEEVVWPLQLQQPTTTAATRRPIAAVRTQTLLSSRALEALHESDQHENSQNKEQQSSQQLDLLAHQQKLVVKLAKQLKKTREQNKQLQRELQLLPNLKQKLRDASRLVRLLLGPNTTKNKYYTKRQQILQAIQQAAWLKCQVAVDNDTPQKNNRSSSCKKEKKNAIFTADTTSQSVVLEDDRTRALEEQNARLTLAVRQLLLVEQEKHKQEPQPHDILEIAYDDHHHQKESVIGASGSTTDDMTSTDYYYTPNGSCCTNNTNDEQLFFDATSVTSGSMA